MSATHPKPARRKLRWPLLGALALVAGLLVWRFAPPAWFGEVPTTRIEGALVRRGPLLISVLARGDLAAADSVDLKSEVEGRTTILSLLPEGSRVKEGDLVCELDATPLIEKRFQQQIAVRNAEAAYVKAKQNFEIQRSQNRSDLAKSNQTLEFARLDLRKFQEGERDSQLEKSRQAIDLAKEDAARARTKLDWSEKLAGKGFLTSSELEADRIAEHRAAIVLQQATRDLDLLERFQLPRTEAELLAAREEAEFERERVELQAKARIVDFEADLSTNEAKLGLETEKLSKLELQIEKARIRAPRAGLLIYAQLDSDEPPIQEGTEVRERQTIASIPSAEGMTARVKLHESVLEQVSLGLPCTITVDALPGKSFEGKVAFVALLPDQNSRWSNPNARWYRTDVAILGGSADMRPGMSCAITVRMEEIPDAIYVPSQAVFRDGDANVSYVLRAGAVEVRPVTVGRYNVENVQIHSGLAEGEMVLLSRPGDLGEQREQPEETDPPLAVEQSTASAPGAQPARE